MLTTNQIARAVEVITNNISDDDDEKAMEGFREEGAFEWVGSNVDDAYEAGVRHGIMQMADQLFGILQLPLPQKSH